MTVESCEFALMTAAQTMMKKKKKKKKKDHSELFF